MAKFKPGDLTYYRDEQGFHVSKILAVDCFETEDGLWECYHMCAYQPVSFLPTADNVADLQVFIMHFPVDPTEVDKDHQFIVNIPVTENEFEGYHAYLEYTGSGNLEQDT